MKAIETNEKYNGKLILEKIAQGLKISSKLSAIFWSFYLHAEFKELLKVWKKRGLKTYLSAAKFFIAINIPKVQVVFLLSPSSTENHKLYPSPNKSELSIHYTKQIVELAYFFLCFLFETS